MQQALFTLPETAWETLEDRPKDLSLQALENGQVLYLPAFCFKHDGLANSAILSENLLNGKRKNISFDYRAQTLGGFKAKSDLPNLEQELRDFMQAYALFARKLVDTLLPHYQQALIWGRTSYRPAEIRGRTSSKRKDDTRLHVDAFAATPVQGLRILRVFCNINPFEQARVWHLGEHFSKVANAFAPRLPRYRPQVAKVLQFLKLTKSLRSAYDHYQLYLHDTMKLDDEYQRSVPKQQIDFAAGSTWLVFTDSVSHAALEGQFLLEQTFYLPAGAMGNPELSPLHFWENV